MPKESAPKRAKQHRHDPLHVQIENAAELKTKAPKLRTLRQEDEADDCVVPAQLSKKILEAAREQEQEEDWDFPGGFGGDDDVRSVCSDAVDCGPGEESDEEADEEGFVFGGAVDEEEEKAMAMFLPSGPTAGGNTLGDAILASMRKAQDSAQAQPDMHDGLSAKAVEVYTKIGKWLKFYKSGKMPKAFKIIPRLRNWEQVLYLTNPMDWSPNAMREATKIFASNLNPKMAQRFYNLVLLPAVREDIARNHKLNFHYYESLKKALFKPAAWFRGILLPLAQENCTLREATIVGSVLVKVSVPVEHAAAALIMLCQQEPWYGTTSVLLTTLINKKYALPMRALKVLMNHFSAFLNDTRELPVVWHKSLLAYVQRYKYDISNEEKNVLKQLIKYQPHAVSGEIHRELFSAPPKELRAAGADAMMCD